MGSLVQRLRDWLDDESVVYECRNCGATVEDPRDSCSVCGTDDIARYDLE